MRINAKIAAALAAVAIYLLLPDLFYAALPLLILAACPLSMFLMMRMMATGKKEGETGSTPVAPSRAPKEDGQ